MSKQKPAWQEKGWAKPGPKGPHSANYVKADSAVDIQNGKRQTGQWIRPTSQFSKLSRVLFRDGGGTDINIHPGKEKRGTVAQRFCRAHSAKKSGKLLFDEPQQIRMVMEKTPEQFPLEALRRVASIISSRIKSLESQSLSNQG